MQDFLRIAGERGYGATIRVYPSLVQGESASAQISAALDRADRDGWAEVIVLIRGGGSLEDLWAFNTRTRGRGHLPLAPARGLRGRA